MIYNLKLDLLSICPDHVFYILEEVGQSEKKTQPFKTQLALVNL
jgi:hypothetical protein